MGLVEKGKDPQARTGPGEETISMEHFKQLSQYSLNLDLPADSLWRETLSDSLDMAICGSKPWMRDLQRPLAHVANGDVGIPARIRSASVS